MFGGDRPRGINLSLKTWFIPRRENSGKKRKAGLTQKQRGGGTKKASIRPGRPAMPGGSGCTIERLGSRGNKKTGKEKLEKKFQKKSNKVERYEKTGGGGKKNIRGESGAGEKKKKNKGPSSLVLNPIKKGGRETQLYRKCKIIPRENWGATGKGGALKVPHKEVILEQAWRGTSTRLKKGSQKRRKSPHNLSGTSKKSLRITGGKPKGRM